MNKPAQEPHKSIAQNRKARFNYNILETAEAGIVLTGAEIKSIRANGISLEQSYIGVMQGELFLLGAHIRPYQFSAQSEIDPLRARKLLMHRREIDRLGGRVSQKGLTLVPLEIYLRRGRAKILVGLGKGKSAPDKRDTIKARESKRELARALKS